MENKIRLPRSVNFFKWLLLVFAILTTSSFLTSVLYLFRPSSGQSLPRSFLVLAGAAAPVFFAAFLAVQKRKSYARWLAFISFTFGAFNVIWASFWYFIIYDGPRNIYTNALNIGLDIIQFGLLGWGSLSFAFLSKEIPKDHSTASYRPPPPPRSFAH